MYHQQCLMLPRVAASIILLVGGACVNEVRGTPIYSALDVHPSGGPESSGLAAASGSRFAGNVTTSAGFGQARVWRADGTSFPLRNSGFTDSAVSDDDGTVLVGNGLANADTRAVRWPSASADPVSLHPAGYSASYALGCGGSQTVGAGFPTSSGQRRALLWTGALSSSVVNLHPLTHSESEAHETDGATQVGYATISGLFRPVLWRGSATSVIDLLPQGFTRGVAYAVDQDQQVGYVRNGSNPARAARWFGSATSFKVYTQRDSMILSQRQLALMLSSDSDRAKRRWDSSTHWLGSTTP